MRLEKIIRSTAIIVFFGAITLFATENSVSPWRFEAGIGLRNTIPVSALAGIGYKQATFRLQGLGAHQGSNDYWCGIRGSLLWNFFGNTPFNFDVGIGGGYDFAEAPNGMHKALNDANNARYVYPYNYKENADISLELWTHLYGIYTQISVPAYRFADHDFPAIMWGIGFINEF